MNGSQPTNTVSNVQ